MVLAVYMFSVRYNITLCGVVLGVIYFGVPMYKQIDCTDSVSVLKCIILVEKSTSSKKLLYLLSREPSVLENTESSINV